MESFAPRLVLLAVVACALLASASAQAPRGTLRGTHARLYSWGGLPRRGPGKAPVIMGTQNLDFLKGPMMTDAEKDMIVKHLQKRHRMLEWGSGGSTTTFSPLVHEYHSIEHSAKFHGQLGQHLTTSNRLTYTLKEVKPGHLGWRGLLQPGTFKQFYPYVKHIDRVRGHNGDNRKFDVLLVDGRARIACAVYALRHIHEDSLVFIHDFFKRVKTREYKRVFDYYDRVEGVDTLVVLKPKPSFVGAAIPDDEIHRLYSWYTGERVAHGTRR